ncbi:uncharacterized protein PRCAT00003801001 [Priceomyces carsonii]|uniref:uncharacterized protein n=1 Tax=Priceomyces carsonii TaxID=28549 RepID=UPI002ED885E6|nr:unnamed protein product [Priceomyces carsonii]
MMDQSNLNASQSMERPIVLSPPPLDRHGGSSGQHLTFNNSTEPNDGYDLQHEFDALAADLDLDLNDKEQGLAGMQSNITNGKSSGGSMSGGNGLLGPTASSYGLLGEFSGGKVTPKSLLTAEDTDSPLAATLSMSNSMGLLGSITGSTFLPPLASVPNRPQSVNDFSPFINQHHQQHPSQTLLSQLDQSNFRQQSKFYETLLFFNSWIENLKPQDSITMIEYLCNNLPLDILLAFKSKLDNHLTHQSQLSQPQGPFASLSPYLLQPLTDISSDMDALHLNDSFRQQQQTQQHQHHHHKPQSQQPQTPQPQHANQYHTLLQQPKPKPNAFKASGHLFVDPKTQRPKSADPSMNGNLRYNNPERSKSPTSHLYEKTNFLQLAANAHSPSFQANQQSSSDDALDMSAHATVKLGALATINSRVALDSNRKTHPQFNDLHYDQPSQMARQHHPLHLTDPMHRVGNPASSSLPFKHTSGLALNNRSPPSNSRGSKKSNALETTGFVSHDTGVHNNNTNGGYNSSNSNSSNSRQAATGINSTSNSSMPPEVSNIELLNNIPVWLKLLRLHKYTDCLKDIPWQKLIEMTDLELEAKGVMALGARRKLLKAFDAVKIGLNAP